MGVTDALQDMGTIKRLLTQAEIEARAVGDAVPGAEHLVLAATALPDRTADRALQCVGIGAQQLRAAISEVHAVALADLGLQDGSNATTELVAPVSGVFRSTPQAQQVFQRAVALSKSTMPSRLRGAHIVAAACDLERGTLARALTALGVDRDRLREAAHADESPRV
jgi:ATP-dependent Clp protease ATP-binding subunit ClpA